MAKRNAATAREIGVRLYGGEDPAVILNYGKEAVEVLDQLGGMFMAIAETSKSGTLANRLAELGRWVADEQANNIGSLLEKIEYHVISEATAGGEA